MGLSKQAQENKAKLLRCFLLIVVRQLMNARAIKNPTGLISILALVAISCQIFLTRYEYGVREDYRAAVPARIAVLPCIPWPDPTFLNTNKQSQELLQAVSAVCMEMDKHVITAFTNQPLLNGFTPQMVQKLLHQSGRKEHLGTLASFFAFPNPPTLAVAKVPSFYEQTIRRQTQWIQWLQELSLGTQYSDTILIPFIYSLQEKQIDDRGLIQAVRQGDAVLLLIDTNGGRLLWSGRSTATVSNHLFSGTTQSLSYPPWDQLIPLLFVPSLWRDFPGKQWN